MEKGTEDILRQIMTAAKKDPEHQALLRRCRELEGAYTSVMGALTEEQRAILDAYFMAVVQVDFCMMRLAYSCGRGRTGRS